MLDTLRAMSTNFDSVQYLYKFSQRHHTKYDEFVNRYMEMGWDRAHAEWIAHREITHTLRNKLFELVEKVGDAPNHYHGGKMSLWKKK